MSKDYREFLKEIYVSRKIKNPRYSLVAFSRDAGFKSYHMSDILSGRYGLSPKRALHVAQNLKLKDVSKEEFLALVNLAYNKSPIDKKIAEEKLSSLKMGLEKTVTDKDCSFFKDWFYLAAFEVFRKNGKIVDAQTLSDVLGISLAEANQVIQTLSPFVSSFEVNGVEVLSLQTQSAISSTVLRQFHRQMIEKSLISMEKDPMSERHFTSFNVYLNDEQYLNLTTEIRAFIRKKISQYQDTNSGDERLYAINMQVFPLEKKHTV